MSESSDSTPSSSTGAFVLRASSAVFSQRSADIFGGLLALENAHKLVTKETKAERQLIKKMAWRETKPAVEALETEKDKRERRKPEYPQQQLQPEVPQFKVPSLPRGQNRRHAQTRLAPGSDGGGRPRDPSRWTYYSLADIDEDGGRGDMQIAADLMRELRRRQDKHQMQLDSHPDGQSTRILFRSTRGSKRPRFEESQPPGGSIAVVTSHIDDIEDPAANEDQTGVDTHFPIFRSRRHRKSRQYGRVAVATREMDSDEEEPEDGELIKSTNQSEPVEQEDDRDDIDNVLDEDAPEGL